MATGGGPITAANISELERVRVHPVQGQRRVPGAPDDRAERDPAVGGHDHDQLQRRAELPVAQFSALGAPRRGGPMAAPLRRYARQIAFPDRRSRTAAPPRQPRGRRGRRRRRSGRRGPTRAIGRRPARRSSTVTSSRRATSGGRRSTPRRMPDASFPRPSRSRAPPRDQPENHDRARRRRSRARQRRRDPRGRRRRSSTGRTTSRRATS